MKSVCVEKDHKEKTAQRKRLHRTPQCGSRLNIVLKESGKQDFLVKKIQTLSSFYSIFWEEIQASLPVRILKDKLSLKERKLPVSLAAIGGV